MFDNSTTPLIHQVTKICPAARVIDYQCVFLTILVIGRINGRYAKNITIDGEPLAEALATTNQHKPAYSTDNRCSTSTIRA